MSEAATVLRESRLAAGMSQAALARAARTSQAAIARYEAGQVNPSVETLDRLISACSRRLGLTTRPLFPGPVGRILEERRAEVMEACARHGARNVRVFGSVARGDDHAGSDVDLLVDLEPGRTLLDVERLQVELSDLLGVGVDVGVPEILREGVSARVRAELTPL